MREIGLSILVVVGVLAGCRSTRTASVTVRAVEAGAAPREPTNPDKVIVYSSPEVAPRAYRVIAHLAYSATNASTESVSDRAGSDAALHNLREPARAYRVTDEKSNLSRTRSSTVRTPVSCRNASSTSRSCCPVTCN
jgi:hypothetical protein